MQQLKFGSSLRIRINNSEKVLMMLLNPEDVPIVAIDWWPPQSKKKMLTIPVDIRCMVIQMEMLAEHDQWTLQTGFPG